MRRSGALTLGLVLTLGGVTGGRGQELSSSVTAASAPSWPSLGGFALPALPENWADLPFKLTAAETTTYNSNINAIPLGFATPAGLSRGDFTTTTNFGFSTKANVYGQQLYFDATFGVIRYLHQVNFNSDVYTVSAGDNWTLTSRCAGNLGVTLSKSPAEITEVVATGVNYLTSNELAETGKCAVSNGYSVLFNGSLTRDTNSNPIDAVNNVRTTMLGAGIEYAKGPSTLTALASIDDTSYTDRTAALIVAGLATAVDFHTFSLSYTRQINPNLSVTGLVGLVGVTSGFTFALPKTLLPIYTLSATWALTPKLSLTASGSRTVAPPTTVIANAEIDYDATMSLTYQVTPKVGLILGGSAGYTTAGFTPTVPAGALSPFFIGASNFYTATAGLTYAMTPFLSAGLTASYTERVGDHLITPQNLVMLNLNYRPY
jgi:hypothetical protein